MAKITANNAGRYSREGLKRGVVGGVGGVSNAPAGVQLSAQLVQSPYVHGVRESNRHSHHSDLQ